MEIKRVLGLFGILLLSFFLLVSCAGQRSKTKTGAAAGAVAGAAIGAVVGHQSGHELEGAAIGAAAGALVGGGIGYYLDKQEEELRQIEELEVRRERDRITATVPASLLFDFDSAIIKPDAVQNLREVAGVMNRYPETRITVKGFTDSAGDEQYNQKLSERRADAVRNFLIGERVLAERITAIGFGEQFPVASNETEEGRQQNRRVEMEIVPTEAPPA